MPPDTIEDFSPIETSQTLGINITWGRINVTAISDGSANKTTAAIINDTNQIAGIQTALADKVNTTDSRLSDARTPLAHTHPQSDVTGLTTALSGKADLVHTHAQSDVTGLTTALDALTNANAHTAGIASQNAASIATLDAGKQNQVSASTTELTPGTSFLATGNIHVVYE